MYNQNEIQITGNLGQNPTMNFTKEKKTPVVNFSVATNRKFKVNGEKKTETTWHRVVVFGKQAELCKQYLVKGQNVSIKGRMQTRSWTDKNSVKRETAELVASNVQFGSKPRAKTE